MNRVLIVGLYDFPHGDAPSNRLLSIAKTFRHAGFDPLVISQGSARSGSVDDIPFTSIRREASGSWGRFARRFATASRVSRATGDVRSVACVYTTLGSLSPSLFFLYRFIWRRPLIVDVMEWFEPSQYQRGKLSLDYWRFWLKFNALRSANIVGITKTICNEFERRGCRTIRIPPQVDVDNFPPHRAVDTLDRIELFYAGTAARKDHLGVALNGLRDLIPDERARIRFTIAGPTRKELVDLVGSEEALADITPSLNIIGRIPRSELLAWLARSHFTVLLRPISRYSMAGFPSKIPETLAAGTPPLLNMTSDLHLYLKDGISCILVADCSASSFSDSLRRTLSLSAPEWLALSEGARLCAADHFDFRQWVEPLKAFVPK